MERDAAERAAVVGAMAGRATRRVRVTWAADRDVSRPLVVIRLGRNLGTGGRGVVSIGPGLRRVRGN